MWFASEISESVEMRLASLEERMYYMSKRISELNAVLDMQEKDCGDGTTQLVSGILRDILKYLNVSYSTY